MIQIIDYQITQNECQELIDMGSENLTNASTLGAVIENYRVAENTWIYSKTELTGKIKKLISDKTGLPTEHQEQIHVVKYNVGGEYKTHHDFFHPNTDYYDDTMKSGGQRVYSCLFYLNDGFEGGETEFPIKKIKVTPKTGRLLIWSNINPDGKLDDESLHAGLPVISGTKWIAIIWVREKSFSQTEVDKTDIKLIEPKINSKLEPVCLDLGQILKESECDTFKQIILEAKEKNWTLETDIRYYNNSYGVVLPFLWDLMDRFKPMIEEKINRKIKNANPYVRVYKNGSTLNSHTDRDGLDYTLSVCLFENINSNWPLIVKNEKNELIENITKIGHASLVTGNILEHWRTPLECNEDEYVIQLFLHYTHI